MKRFHKQFGIVFIVLMCGVSFIEIVDVVWNKPEQSVNFRVTVCHSSPIAIPIRQDQLRAGFSVRVPINNMPQITSITRVYSSPTPTTSSSYEVYMTSEAKRQREKSCTYRLSTSLNNSSRQIISYGEEKTMPKNNFIAIASSRQMAQPEAQEAPQMARMTSSSRHAPGPPNPPGPLPDDHQLVEHPIGDGVCPLLLMALAFCCWRYHRRRKNMALYIMILFLAACSPQKEREETCASTIRYSREIINARMSSWYNKDVQVGFPNANSTNGIRCPETEASWDYVPGVVAKGILDVWECYQDSSWADAWYEGMCQWGLTKIATDQGGVLDDLNCAKVFVGLYNGAKPGGRFENAENAAYFMEQMRRGARGLADHKARFSIVSGGAERGWMHKASANPSKSYWGQMWCDGAYMGPALLAQLLAVGATEGTDLGWNDVYDQFHASWPYLWDEEKRLPYHVICTDISKNENARILYESGHLYSCKMDTSIYHSEEYWGRAAGWYMLALVDVLEAYLRSLEAKGEWSEGEPLPSAQHFDMLREYLTQLADGLVERQDPETGCWFQLLQYGSAKSATQGIDDTGSSRFVNVAEGETQHNYLESSASCLITAALLKGTRLGLIHHAEAGKRGFEGVLKTFLRGKVGNYNLISSCQSAGLSHDRNGSAAYYLIGKDVSIQNNTEGKVLGAFLMAALEYERLESEGYSD